MNVNIILQDVLRQAKEIGIPVSDKIDPTVILNTRAKKRYGRCILQNGTYTIEISAYLVDAGLRTIHEVIVHEVLHTCPGCMNHGPLWKQYASMMTKRYGYTVERTAKTPLIGRPASSGLGLQLSAQFAGMMNGTIGSVRHQSGMTFYVQMLPSEQLALL